MSFDEPYLIQCPYDKSHMITPLRMPYHLMKCRKNHPTVDMAVCPYNAIHEVCKAELKYHMTNCRDRRLVEREIAFGTSLKATQGIEKPVLKGYTDLPSLPDKTTEMTEVGSDEDWEPDHEMETRQPFTVSRTAQGLIDTGTVVEKPIVQPVLDQNLSFLLGRGRGRLALQPDNVKIGLTTANPTRFNYPDVTFRPLLARGRDHEMETRQPFTVSRTAQGLIDTGTVVEKPIVQPVLDQNLSFLLGRGRGRLALQPDNVKIGLTIANPTRFNYPDVTFRPLLARGRGQPPV